MKPANQPIQADLAVPASSSPRTIISPTLTTVDTIMTRKVVTVTPDTSVETLVELMLSGGLSRIPVIDGEGRPVGMVAKTDLVEDQFDRVLEAEEAGPTVCANKGVRYRLDGLRAEPVRTVFELMTDSAVSVKLGTSIKEAARAMSLQNLHGLPVVDSAGKLVGVVSALDVVAWVCREC